MNKVIYVCAECGSSDVQWLAWCTTNGDEVVSAGPGDTEDYWCPECAEHTEQIPQEEYNEQQKIEGDETIKEKD